MKDSYSFDIDRSSAIRTYEEYVQTYTDLFRTIGTPTKIVQADAGHIGGSLSHEFHIPSDIGEDTLMQCTACSWSTNFEMAGDVSTCPQCQATVERCKGIEVAHTFLLDDKYSKPLGAKFLHANGKPTTLTMGCYGIGISRLIAASIENLSKEQEIRWPFVLAPFSVCIIPPKRGSREMESVAHLTDLVYGELTKTQELSDDVVVDDRTGLTIGKRMLEAKRLGYPLIVVIGKDAAGVDGKYELHFTNTETVKRLSFDELLGEIRNEVSSHRYR
ncbi:hypothetical protein HA402_015630 [Bradysia odoriphaga]|nr:hypothetical protein HA402_015630 [Bradysia odoriphaga]